MKTVFMYAGQGSQRVGMGNDIYEVYPEYREVVDGTELDFDFRKLMKEGELETLSQTEYTQPCMAVFAAGVTEVLKNHGIIPDAACGLSLGEYGALYAAGVFDAKDYVAITAFRGNAMAQAAKGQECSMSAILGMQAEQVEEVCKKVNDTKTYGYVSLVNYNCPGQYVICGDETAVAKAEELLKEEGMKRSIRLNVSGPFHTKYMKPAAEKLEAYLENISFAEPQIPVVLNMTGNYYDGESSIKENLCMQIQNGVHFEESITRLIEDGADTFIEIGPGNTLAGFVKKIAKACKRSVSIYTIDKVEDLDVALETLA